MDATATIAGNGRAEAPFGDRAGGPACGRDARFLRDAGCAADLWLLFRSGDDAKAAANVNNRRLTEAAAARGVRAAIVDPARIGLFARRPRETTLTLDGRPVAAPAAAILRTGARLGPHGIAVAGALAGAGTAGLAPLAGIEAATDKLAGAALCRAAGLPTPLTLDAGKRPDPARLGAILGWPFVLKGRAGSKGREVRLCADPAEAAEAMEDLRGAGPLIAQEWIATSAGVDRRILVIGGEVAAAVERRAAPGEFRSNVACGASARAVTPDRASAALALAAQRVTGLAVAGIDILSGPVGPLICEINAAPGFEALERATGRDIAGRILDHLAPALRAQGRSLRAASHAAQMERRA